MFSKHFEFTFSLRNSQIDFLHLLSVFFAKVNSVYVPALTNPQRWNILQSKSTSIHHGACLRTCKTECYEAISVVHDITLGHDICQMVSHCGSSQKHSSTKAPRPGKDRRMKLLYCFFLYGFPASIHSGSKRIARVFSPKKDRS